MILTGRPQYKTSTIFTGREWITDTAYVIIIPKKNHQSHLGCRILINGGAIGNSDGTNNSQRIPGRLSLSNPVRSFAVFGTWLVLYRNSQMLKYVVEINVLAHPCPGQRNSFLARQLLFPNSLPFYVPTRGHPLAPTHCQHRKPIARYDIMISSSPIARR